MINVCLSGDSVAKGVVLDEESGRYRILSENFAALCAIKTGVALENFGKFGSTVGNGKITLEKYLARSPKCDYILFEFGGNDCDFDWQAVSDAPEGRHYPKTGRDEYISIYKSMLDRAKSYGSKPVLLSLPPIDSEKYFNTVSRGRNPENILAWLQGDKGFISRWHETYNLAVFTLARECAVPLIDITTCFYSQRNYTGFLCSDGIHPNAAGHALIAESIQSYAELHIQA